jgi:SnoaL-like protein
VVDEHPFQAAWRTRDLDAWTDALADDVVLHSPVMTTPFRGREAARELYSILFEAFGEVEVTDAFAAGDMRAFFWRGELGGRRIQGTDLIRADARGKVAEVTVLIRPLVDIAVFAAAVGPALARRRGPIRGLLLRLLTLPLRALMAAADFAAPRLSMRRRAR